MAALPGNNTGVLFVDYEVGGEEHTSQLRFADSTDEFASMVVLDAFWTALVSVLFRITILGARVRAKGSNVTLPSTWSGAATYGTGTAAHAQSAWYYDFIGRSAEGRRVRLSTFGANALVDVSGDDYRIPIVGAFIPALAALVAGGDAAVAIDELIPVWYTYVNSGANAYWRNRIR